MFDPLLHYTYLAVCYNISFDTLLQHKCLTHFQNINVLHNVTVKLSYCYTIKFCNSDID